MTNSNRIEKPWTPGQVEALNAYQQSGRFHPFTCGNKKYKDGIHLDGEGILVATSEGWVCPFCEYKQGWAWEFMLDQLW